jgi:hypothetical protein
VTDDSARPKAVIGVSSASQRPLTKPKAAASIGYFLVELAAAVAHFEDAHDFVLATPDGKIPTLAINGMALGMHSGANIGPASVRVATQNERYS